jgi:hypothetical protein
LSDGEKCQKKTKICENSNVWHALFSKEKRKARVMYPLITRDPVSGEELIVTRLECPESGIVIEGRFSLGWIGRLTREQLDFVELMVKYRGNVQKLAAEMNIAYNTARSRLDEIVAALGGTPENDGHVDRRAILDRLASKEISVEEAMKQLKG